MRKLFFFACLLFSLAAAAQQPIPSTESFTIEGAVKNRTTVKQTGLDSFASHSIDSLVIYNHLMQPRRTATGIKGVRLRDLLDKAVIEGAPKQLSEVYITCIATDGYKVVFSWNELYNTSVGDEVLVLTESDGKKGLAMESRMALLSAADAATGRRYVKGLQRVVVERVK